MRFLDIAFSGRSGRSQIESEGPLEIAVGVQPPTSESIANVTIRLELVSTSGVALATLATTVDTTALRGLAHEGRAALKCRVDELPLRQGNYFVTIRAIAGTELLDQVADQVEITVTAPGDEPQPTSDLQHAPVIVRQHWDVGAPVAASSIAS
jgi:hypothetical protein